MVTMSTQTSPVTWAENQPTPLPPEHTRRTQADLRDFIERLADHPNRWAVYSTHLTRGAARQRIYVLRRSATFEGQPLEWRSAKVQRGDDASPVQILVRWVGDEDED